MLKTGIVVAGGAVAEKEAAVGAGMMVVKEVAIGAMKAVADGGEAVAMVGKVAVMAGLLPWSLAGWLVMAWHHRARTTFNQFQFIHNQLPFLVE